MSNSYEIGRAIGAAISKSYQALFYFVYSCIRAFHTVPHHSGHWILRSAVAIALLDVVANFFVHNGTYQRRHLQS